MAIGGMMERAMSDRFAAAVREVFSRCVPASKAELAQRIVVAVSLCLFAYGVVMYPDGPIRPCGEAAYCEKGGTSRSEAEFRAFKRWEITTLITVLISAPLYYFLTRYRSKGRELSK
jgi:hypothetical protein